MVDFFTNRILIIRNKIFFCALFSLFFFSFNNVLYAQGAVNEYDVKKMMILKVTTFIEWPKKSKVNDKQSNIVISIIGDNPFNGKLKKLVANQNQKINNKQVVVNYIKSIEDIEGSDILFICSSEKYIVSKIIKHARNKAILTIADTRGFTEKGVIIGLFIRNGKIALNINKKEADKCGFYISSSLLGNAVKVIQ
ncbi:MAG: hypothetical protein B6I20_12185 [Bacteroidetes bacterium 4572_117]|nr:MAG: hypothetical protein B6I20_12185 [Bacteroidetes bacterium 4572_117]